MYRLLILTATGCGFCKKFKNNDENGLNPLKKKLEELNIKYDYVETVYGDNNKIISDINLYDNRIYPYLEWFPTFLLIEESSFNDENAFLDAHVYGTIRKNKKEHHYVTERINRIINTDTDIIRWILTIYSPKVNGKSHPSLQNDNEVVLTRNGKKFSSIPEKINQDGSSTNVRFVYDENSSDEEYFTV